MNSARRRGAVRRLGITGHRGLTGPVTDWVRQALRGCLSAELPPLAGVTCLADGADQLFARAVLDVDGSLHVIVPARAYRAGLPGESHRDYDELLAAASCVERLDYEDSDERAHMAASVLMLDHVDQLIAVWDGPPARGHGGTADVVALAPFPRHPCHRPVAPGSHARLTPDRRPDVAGTCAGAGSHAGCPRSGDRPSEPCGPPGA